MYEGDRNFLGANEMRVELTEPAGALIVDGVLASVIVSEQDGPFPHMVLQMRVTGRDDPVHVTLGELDLFTIMTLAKSSEVEKIRDAIRVR